MKSKSPPQKYLKSPWREGQVTYPVILSLFLNSGYRQEILGLKQGLRNQVVKMDGGAQAGLTTKRWGDAEQAGSYKFRQQELDKMLVN